MVVGIQQSYISLCWVKSKSHGLLKTEKSMITWVKDIYFENIQKSLQVAGTVKEIAEVQCLCSSCMEGKPAGQAGEEKKNRETVQNHIWWSLRLPSKMCSAEGRRISLTVEKPHKHSFSQVIKANLAVISHIHGMSLV